MERCGELFPGVGGEVFGGMAGDGRQGFACCGFPCFLLAGGEVVPVRRGGRVGGGGMRLVEGAGDGFGVVAVHDVVWCGEESYEPQITQMDTDDRRVSCERMIRE